uniref:Ycf1 protein n=1 Tax=Crassula deltoidea TaxID=91077 RepID=UPI002E7A7086|nr:Ycf1 protein [Crassula deltoidea]WPS93286.1 Ycf1 protein [Crassula deltoidea]
MILTSFLLGNLVALCMKIINSVVVVGLYYGFLTTFSIGPSYLLLLRAQVMEEGTEKRVSATTGFITGQLMMFLSIYYAPLHLALGRPHTITILALPHLLFHFFWNNQKHFFDSRSTNKNSLRNLSIQCVFLNNLIFQLFNYFILPSSMLARLVNIYMFRCNNKMLFVTSSFVGWLIGHVLFMKWVGLVLVWIRQNNSIRLNKDIRSNKYLVSEVRNSMARLFSIFLFITCVYSLGRIPSTMVLKETSVTEERGESIEETDVEMENTSETKGTKEEQEGSTEEDPSPSLLSEEKEDPDNIDETEEIQVNGKEKTKDEFHFHFKETCYKNSPVYETSKLELLKKKETKFGNKLETLITPLFDYKRCKRPLRYIKNNQFESSVINEMSQYFFFPVQIMEKKRISFTYPPSLKTFLEILQRKLSLFKSENLDLDEIENIWVYQNEQTETNLRTEFINRIYALERGSLSLDGLTRLRTALTKKEYLIKKKDPLLKGLDRGPIKNNLSPLILSDIINRRDLFFINKIHGLFFANNLIEFEQIMSMYNKKRKTFLLSVGIQEISKKIPRWSYKLIDEVERQQQEEEATAAEEPGIRSRKALMSVIFTINEPVYNNYYDPEEFDLRVYSDEPDFRRNIIKGSLRAQRRKIPILKLSQSVHSPLFLYRLDKSPFSFFDIPGLIKLTFRNWMEKTTEFQISEKSEKKDKKKKYTKQSKISIQPENAIIHPEIIRTSILIIQSILRKYIVLPSLIIVKNLGRILLFQFPEWSEDFENWNKETHVKCTCDGVQLSEKDLPKDWLTAGIQIKILFPFSLKPWYRSKPKSPKIDGLKKKEKERKRKKFCFLTVWGRTTEHPSGPLQKQPSFFLPILKELIKKFLKLKTKFFFLLKMLKERKKWINKSVLFINRLINGPAKKNQISVFGLSEIDEWGETQNENHLIKNKEIIYDTPIRTRPKTWTKDSLTEKKMKDLNTRTTAIRNQLEQILKDKTKEFQTPERMNKFKSNVGKKLPYKKPSFQIVKKRITRLIFNYQFFSRFFLQKLYSKVLLGPINRMKMKAKLFFSFELRKNKMDKYSSNKKQKKEGGIHFRKSFFYIYITNKNSKTKIDLTSLSQAYVVYKLSQNKAIYLDNLRLNSALQYDEKSLFLKDKRRPDYSFGVQDRAEFIHTTLLNSAINQWNTWLRNHYQYNISHIRWSGFVPKKWKNKLNHHSMIQNENRDFGEKENDNDYELIPLSNQKQNCKKNYQYDRFSFKSINYENKKNSSISVVPSNFKKNQKISYNYTADKRNHFKLGGKNSIGEDTVPGVEKKKTYFDFGMLYFCRKRVDIETCIQNNIKNTKTRNYQLIEKMDKRSLFAITTPHTKQAHLMIHSFFSWLEMNKDFPILNLELWFFPELILLYNIYKLKPWIIPIKSLFVEKENIGLKKKHNFFISSSNKFENKNKEKRNVYQRNLGSAFLKQEGGVSEYGTDSDLKKRKTESTTEEDLDFFLTRHLLVQLRWPYSCKLRIMKNIKVYCLLLSLRNPRESALSAIQTREIKLDIVPSYKYVTEWLQKGIFFIEPVRLSVNNSGQFLMYQTLHVSLVQKNNCKTNQRYREKRDFEKSIEKPEKIIGNRDIKNDRLLVLETLLSPRRRRELRIRISFNSKKNRGIDLNRVFSSGKSGTIYGPFLVDSYYFDRLKFFVWPSSRLEDLACMNRYWFNTTNGSSFSMLRIRMYP